jgi:hypothetical protein
VLAILYLFPVSLFTILQMPKEIDVKRQWASATIDIVKKYDEDRKNDSTWRILDAYSDMSYDGSLYNPARGDPHRYPLFQSEIHKP